ncbi:juvenile hormone epoxide hydrolase 1-like [Phymastichus coffea]|uniref:juvenile hormone epoxide hydrolase 1-like n=1 Tax=Phymastichus coffea TaxID=108790 RepID=UPI00273B61C8|nr:juvenile hormone epoxide hydrolase 1-like [Phymastichus coffea]
MDITDVIYVVIKALLGIWSNFTSVNLPSMQLANPYWGPGEPPINPDLSIRPFKVHFSNEVVNDLKYRLNHTKKLQSTLENAASTYGINSEFLPKVIEYWLHKYNFKEREAHLNQYPQFITNVQGLDIHYVHAKPQLPKDSGIEVLPLLIQHGWPGSVVEFYKVIPKLTAPSAERNFVFEVIAPSLPGFGYSDAAAKIGLGATEIATVLKILMGRIGHDKFYAQGGDWGGIVLANLASMYPEVVLGLHSNFCVLSSPSALLKLAYYSLQPSLLLEYERPYMPSFGQLLYQLVERSAYYHEQATRPDSFGVGLNDSPAGLAAYVLEKFSEAANYDNRFSDDGNLSQHYAMDDLIDNLMYYWAPAKITSSMRIYAESSSLLSIMSSSLNADLITVPSACTAFPHEIIFIPEVLLRTRYVNLVQRTLKPRGGHFAALEEPQLFVDDVFAAVEKMRRRGAAE